MKMTFTTVVEPQRIEPTVSEINGPDQKNDNNLQFVWLICIPVVIIFGVGKFLYERRHNTVANRAESVCGTNVCASTQKFFEEERKYRQMNESKHQPNENELHKYTHMVEVPISSKCPKDASEVDGFCFFEMVDIKEK